MSKVRASLPAGSGTVVISGPGGVIPEAWLCKPQACGWVTENPQSNSQLPTL